MLIKKIKDYYRLLKVKKVDNILIYVGIAGVAGVVIGLNSIPIINEIAV